MNISLVNKEDTTKGKGTYKYTEEELLEYIRELYNKSGEPPTLKDLRNNIKCPDPETYRYRFGSFNKALEKALNINREKYRKYSDNELFDYIKQFYKENGRPPTIRDFADKYPKYPSVVVYQKRFGSWENALKTVELDTESMIKKGFVQTNNQKGRLAEMIVRDHFKTNPIDLAGTNHNSPCDGICPNGKVYDVKSSALHDENFFEFGLRRHDKEKLDEIIDIYYLLGFNNDYSKLMHAWRIGSIDIIHKDTLYVGLNHGSHAEFTADNMDHYNITNYIREILKGFYKINIR